MILHPAPEHLSWCKGTNLYRIGFVSISMVENEYGDEYANYFVLDIREPYSPTFSNSWMPL